MQLLQVDVELAARWTTRAVSRGGPVGAVEAVEAASEAIITEKGNLIGLEPEDAQGRDEQPTRKCVEGTACEGEGW